MIDGYNIIHAWGELKRLADENLEEARNKLIDIISNYQGVRNIDMIIVFDAYKVKNATRKAYKHNNIYLVFTKEAETADHYIEKVVRNTGRNYRVSVATSDALEQAIILSKGAIRVTPRELLSDIKRIENDVRANFTEYKPPKSNMLFDNLDPETAAWFEEMRRKKEI